MGDIADAMLDGTLCAGCGEYIGNDSGYPGYCSPECGEGGGGWKVYMTPPEKPYSCDGCTRRFGSDKARAQHRRDTHERRPRRR